MSIYLGSNDFLYMAWYGYSTFDDVKEGCLMLVDSMIEYGCGSIVHDDRRIKGTWSHSLAWLEEVFMPKMLANGLKKTAHIYSEDEVAQYSMDRFLEKDFDYEDMVFSDFRNAVQWLKGYAFDPPSNEELTPSDRRNYQNEMNPDELFFVSKHGNKSILYMKERQIETRRPLKDIMEQLPSSDFMRVHQGNIINVKKVTELKYRSGGHYNAFFKDFGGIYVPVSRTKIQDLKKAMNLVDRSSSSS
ncbi:MAG: LytTR family transcriptional regulator [Flavobacteriales bacterium]|nr:LytTR family transcriptional regulator [Flavobacteriales bacterium]